MNSARRFTSLILLFSGLGSLLSGYLSYWNLFGNECSQGPLSWLVSCGTGPKPVLIFGQPTCAYGFVMFFAVFIIGLFAIKKLSKGLITTFIVLGIAGSLFSGYLAVYEIWFLKLTYNSLPSCVYGFFFYVGVLITSIIACRGLCKPASTEMPPVAPTTV
jgi:uncharacterized membrane protein